MVLNPTSTTSKNALDDDEKGVADKIDEGEKNELITIVDEALDWLEENPEADAEEFEEKQKEVEQIANPISLKKVYSQGGAPGGDDETSTKTSGMTSYKYSSREKQRYFILTFWSVTVEKGILQMIRAGLNSLPAISNQFVVVCIASPNTPASVLSSVRSAS